MSKLKHTPGPWVISEQDIIGNEPGGYICTWSGRFANARLIAAAPEMIEALISVYQIYIDRDICCDNEFIKSVIEKATGMSIEEILK